MQKVFKSNIIEIIIILLVSYLLILPLFIPGLYQIHDDQQIARLFLFDKAASAGQFPVRWVDELGFGFGYPLFVFYPPLVYIVGEIFKLFGAGIIDSVKIVFALSIILSSITMYVFGKSIYGRMGGLISALFYMTSPYRAIDVYIRGALSEAFSFVWLPLILLSFYKMSQDKGFNNKYVLIAILSLALLMITHNLVFLPFSIFLAIFIVYLFLVSKNKKTFSISCLFSLVLAAGLSAFFWVPSLLEKKYTIVDQILLTNLADYRIHFVYLQQLWNWPWGFGGSGAGLNDGISFKIGKLNVVLSLITFFLALTVIKIRSKEPQVKLAILFFVLFIFAGFMTTSYSEIIWQALPPLAYLQFPWRFLIFTTLFSSILAGLFIYIIKLPILRIILGIILITLLIATNLKLFKPQLYRSWLNDSNATSKEVINWDVSSTSFEYAPKDVPLYKSKLGSDIFDLKKAEIPKEKIEVINGTASIKNLIDKPQLVKFRLNALTNSVIKANIFNFPLWVVNIDGQRVKILDNNKYKLITFPVEKGNHEVSIEFKNTSTRTVAGLISVLSLILVLLLPFKKWNQISV